MGLFDAKYCSICGNKIGLLGNRKLEDGNLCKDCASKLSPWFNERRHSTVAEIKEHLAYRDRNALGIASLHPTKVLGNNYKVYIDENLKKFVVTRQRDFRSGNPDIVDLSQVMNATYKVTEDKDEIYTKDAEGKRVSYDPKQYEYEYRFDVTISVDSPYFSEIDFELSDQRPDSNTSEEYQMMVNQAEEICAALLGKDFTPKPVVPDNGGTDEPAEDGTWVCPKCGAKNTGKFCMECGTPQPANESGNELWECPNCHRANRGKFCMECGTPKPVHKCPKCGWEPEDKNAVPKFCPNCGEKLN